MGWKVLAVSNTEPGYMAEHNVCKVALGRGQGQVIPAGQEAPLWRCAMVERAMCAQEPAPHHGHPTDLAGAHTGKLRLPMGTSCALVHNPGVCKTPVPRRFGTRDT